VSLLPVAIPSVAQVRDPQTRAILDALRKNVETLYRQRGDRDDSAVLVSDLLTAGSIGWNVSGTIYRRDFDTTEPFVEHDDDGPPQPEWGLIDGDPAHLILNWEMPFFDEWKATRLWTSADSTFGNGSLYSIVRAPVTTFALPLDYAADEQVFAWLQYEGNDGRTGAWSPVAAHVYADFSVGAGKATGAHSLGTALPDNAVITRGWYEVTTTFTSAGDTATISLDVATNDVAGIVAAIAINHATNPWDDINADVDTIQDGQSANYSTQTTAARNLQATVGVQALTAGILRLYVFYKVTE